jgi:hypothetical protein
MGGARGSTPAALAGVVDHQTVHRCKSLDDKSGFVARETAVNILPSASLFHFDFYEPLPIQIEVSDAPLTSDAGLLPLRRRPLKVIQSQLLGDLRDFVSHGLRPLKHLLPVLHQGVSRDQEMRRLEVKGWSEVGEGCPLGGTGWK